MDELRKEHMQYAKRILGNETPPHGYQVRLSFWEAIKLAILIKVKGRKNLSVRFVRGNK